MHRQILRAIRQVGRILCFPTRMVGPEIVDLGVTSACNHNCYFCDQHSYLRSSRPTPQTLEPDLVNKILNDCCKLYVKKITLAANGEQLLIKGLPELIKTYSSKLDFQIASNGTSLYRINRNLFEHVADITISINSVRPHTHQLIHGYKGTEQLSKITEELNRLLSYPDSNKKILISYAITADNFHEFEDLTVFIAENNCRFSIRPVHLNFTELEKHNKGLTIEQQQFLIDKTKALISKNRRNPRLKIIYKNLLQSLIEVDKNYARKRQSLGSCFFAFKTINVWSNGDVTQCTYSSQPIGNVYQSGLIDIWKSKAMRTNIIKGLTMSLTNDAPYSYCTKCTEPADFTRLYGSSPSSKDSTTS